MKQHEVGGYYARLADLGATTVDDLAHVDPYMLKRDHEIVAYRKVAIRVHTLSCNCNYTHIAFARLQIRSNALTRKEKAVVLKYGHPTPLRASSAATAVTSTSKPAAPAQPRTAFAIKDELSREHIVLNAARRAIFGLPKLMFDDEADDEVLEDSGSSDGRSR